jgi:NADH:ubiquinone oxidoreductase subunit E
VIAQEADMAVVEVDLAPARRIVAGFAGQRGNLITVLQAIQEAYGYLPRESLVEVAAGLGMTQSQVYGVATFYAQFYLEKRGRHVVKTCDGTACHVRGGNRLIETVQRELGIGPGETTPDYGFTYEVVYCLGSCGLSPVAVIDGQVIGRLTPGRLTQILRRMKAEALTAAVHSQATATAAARG